MEVERKWKHMLIDKSPLSFFLPLEQALYYNGGYVPLWWQKV
jgi:hypothetical protein